MSSWNSFNKLSKVKILAKDFYSDQLKTRAKYSSWLNALLSSTNGITVHM